MTARVADVIIEHRTRPARPGPGNRGPSGTGSLARQRSSGQAATWRRNMQAKAPRRTRDRILDTSLRLFNSIGEPNVSATAIAETDCVVVPLSEQQFLTLVREAPYFALEVMRVLARRIRAANAVTVN